MKPKALKGPMRAFGGKRHSRDTNYEGNGTKYRFKVMREGEMRTSFPHSRNTIKRFWEWLCLTYYRYGLMTGVYVMTLVIGACVSTMAK
eukprot:jgi/Galph1/1535/GphlegSOOS_G221.1